MTKLLGNDNGMSKLNPDIVREIRASAKLRLQLSNKGLARKFNVSVDSIRNVLKGARWKWVK
jgi:DNA-binding transcriptional regulator YiaG